jgi:Flp pilus assembly pilin Flp
MKEISLLKLLKKIHEDEDGSVSLETILIVGAIALPILIFLIVKAWPTIKAYFNTNLDDLTTAGPTAEQ